MSASKDPNPFRGTALYYARFREKYPSALFDYLKSEFKLNGSGRLLDIGCGTGQLAIPLARYFEEVVGMDPDSEMLDEARREVDRHCLTNITWVRGGSYDLKPQMGTFRLVTMGKSFHWTDRERTLEILYDMVIPEGTIAIISEGDWVWNQKSDWQYAVRNVVERWGGGKRRAGYSFFEKPKERHEEVVSRSGFKKMKIWAHDYQRIWNVEKIAGYLYSTSYCSSSVLGDKKDEFERDLKNTMIKNESYDEFKEDVKLEAILAWKE